MFKSNSGRTEMGHNSESAKKDDKNKQRKLAKI